MPLSPRPAKPGQALEDIHRANDLPIRNPSPNAHEKPSIGDHSGMGYFGPTRDLRSRCRAIGLYLRQRDCEFV